MYHVVEKHRLPQHYDWKKILAGKYDLNRRIGNYHISKWHDDIAKKNYTLILGIYAASPFVPAGCN